MATPTVPTDPTASIDPEDRIHARRWGTLAVLSLSLVIIGLDNTILNVALPSLREHFDASNSTLQWIVDGRIAEITTFGPSLFHAFGLAATLDPAVAAAS